MTAGIGIIAIGSMILLLWFAGEAAKGIRQGLSAACELLVPSLLPFMVLSSFLIFRALLRQDDKTLVSIAAGNGWYNSVEFYRRFSGGG